MNCLRFSTIIVCIIIFFVKQTTSQTTDFKFNQIGLEQGLSQSTVNSIVQDKQGFMWFGTQDGLNRYDGYSILVFKHSASNSNSLADDNAFSLINDRDGDLWIGTRYHGLDRYEISKNRFIHYKHNEVNNTTISDDYITTIFEDSEGAIWAGTRNKGLNKFNRDTNTFTRFLYDAEDTTSLSNNIVWAISEDRSKNLWIGTGDGICKLEKKSGNNIYFKRYNLFNSLIGKRGHLNVVSLFTDHQGTIWIGTWGSGLLSFDEKSNTSISYFHSDYDRKSITSNFIRSIYEDSEGHLWIATNDGGLNLFNKQTKSFVHVNDDMVESIYEDKSGIVWMGTFDNGVKSYDKRKNRFKHFYDDPNNSNDMHGNCVTALFVDSEGELWAGTYDSGLNRFDRLRNTVTNYSFDPKNPNSINNNRIYSIGETSDGNIWVGTDEGLNQFNKKTGRFIHYIHSKTNNNTITNNNIISLYIDPKDNIWIGNQLGGIDIFQPSKNKFVHYLANKGNSNSLKGVTVCKIYQDSKGTIWVGTMDGGLFRFIPGSVSSNDSGSFVGYTPALIANKSIDNSTVLSLYEDNKNILWIGTDGGGLNRFDIKNNSFKYFTIEQGLPNNIIYGIVPDNSGNLWLSTNNGICRFNPETAICKNFNVMDGLQANEFNQGAYFRSKDRELFFGGINGFTAFFPDSISDNQYIPPVYVTSFKVFNKNLVLPDVITATKSIQLLYSQNFFSFEFAALNYTSPGKNQYAYMLEGFDKEWYKLTALQRYGSYTNLDPGKYVLRIKGSNNDGIWNDKGASIAIVVVPPYWMTWWFRGILIFVIISFVFFIYYRRVQSLKMERSLQQEVSHRLIEKQEEERTRIAQEMHDSLGQDLLFIKNRLLLTIQDTKDDPKTSENLNQISEDVSQALKSVREISHNLRPPDLDRLGLRETLLSLLLAFRKSTSLKVTGEVENLNGLIPPELEINIVRIFQEALGNILKHSGATECQVLMIKRNDSLDIEISDNGRGFEPNSFVTGKVRSSGLGLMGMVERVKILGGKMMINSSPGKGTRIEISIALNHNKENNLNKKIDNAKI